MNDILKQRVAALKEVIRRIEQDDYEEFPYGDTDELVLQLKGVREWEKELKPPSITQFIVGQREREDAQYDNRIIEENNKRIKKDFIKPREDKIKVLELESILFHGLFEMSELSKEIHSRVYPKEEGII